MAKSKSSIGEIFFCSISVAHYNFFDNYSAIRMD